LRKNPIPLGNGVTGTVAKTGIPEIVGDITQDTRYIPHKRDGSSILYAPIKSEICVPIKYKNKIIGVLNAESDHLNHFTHHDLNFLSALADQSGIAIQNALFYERIENFNEELRNKIDTATSKLRNANVELQRLNKIKSDFVSIVSHELRTPMTSIVGYVSLLADEEVGPITPEQKEFLEIVKEESNRLTRLISDLLDISKIESGKMNVELDDVDLTQFLMKYQNKIKDMTKEKQLNFNFEGPANSIIIKGNLDKIDQILTNLVSNAIKFSEQNKNLKLRLHENINHVQLDVIDEGMGILPEQAEKIFDKFHQVDSEFTRSIGGTGLGLAISKHLVESHGGKIWVNSTIGEGSTFSFTLMKADLKADQLVSQVQTQK
tara:strand:- start:1527 stop:2657 length:1131 start_codon:yes stop_codon:yes gene_type:complete